MAANHRQSPQLILIQFVVFLLEQKSKKEQTEPG
jgi:hypothetical protein